MKVRYFTTDGPKRFEYVERWPEDYHEQRTRWRDRQGVRLPMRDDLDEFGDRGDLRILCGGVLIFVKFENSSWLELDFRPGFITDLASVPRPLRGIVDQDDGRILPAVLVHDYLFATRRLPFRYTNRLFYRMMRANGYPRFRSWLAWLAVSSPAGRRAWRAGGDVRDAWTRKHVGFFMPRPVNIGGREYRGDKWNA